MFHRSACTLAQVYIFGAPTISRSGAQEVLAAISAVSVVLCLQVWKSCVEATQFTAPTACRVSSYRPTQLSLILTVLIFAFFSLHFCPEQRHHLKGSQTQCSYSYVVMVILLTDYFFSNIIQSHTHNLGVSD